MIAGQDHAVNGDEKDHHDHHHGDDDHHHDDDDDNLFSFLALQGEPMLLQGKARDQTGECLCPFPVPFIIIIIINNYCDYYCYQYLLLLLL